MSRSCATPRPLTIVGAGLSGTLLAILLARRGWSVEIFERRPDPRVFATSEGRSINLALAERGLHALRVAGLSDAVMSDAVMMRGRSVHPVSGEPQLHRYGRDDSEVIWSVHRGRLNAALLDASERAGVRVHFAQRVSSVDLQSRTMQLIDSASGVPRSHAFRSVLGCDGAGSAVRTAVCAATDAEEAFEPLGHGYKELNIPVGPDGRPRLAYDALHIWPRGGYMCIALPNSDGTFTATAFLPSEGEPSFAAYPDVASARAFFEREMPTLIQQVPAFDGEWRANPVSGLGTLRVSQWSFEDRALLLGDAAHAMVPFHGQGMNCAFEDCLALDHRIAVDGDLAEAFTRFEQERRPNTDAIQTMALENYIEMRDRVGDARFLLQRSVEQLLALRHPGHFVPRYAMVSFTRLPYALALARGRVQRRILEDVTRQASRLDDVDLLAADHLVRTELAPLPSIA